MTLVVIESTDGQAPVAVYSPTAARLVDICDQESAPVPFSCRSACCGTCRVQVLEGANLLDPALEDELEVLEAFGDDPAECRLACQARLRGGSGKLRVRAAP
jgi:2Fe-2S ferredoxin